MSQPKKDEPLQSLAHGFRDRTIVTLKLASKMGVSMLGKSLGTSSEKAVDAADAERAAIALVEQLGSMKGLLMKFGQMASYLDGTLPPGAQRALARLQSSTQPMAFAKVDEVIASELGSGAHHLFEAFEETPIAAASIGQVHRARYGGRAVAVKVQYPGIEQVLASDLKLVGTLARLSLIGGATDGKALADELRARILEECDYTAEARNQRVFAGLLASEPRASVPAVVADRSARRVLTSDFSRGTSFQRFVDEASQDAKNSAAAAIFEACFTCIFRHCVYNADPHPGNYLFQSDGSVVFLDFGCVRRFDPAMIDTWKTVALAFLDGNREAVRAGTIALGLASDSPKYDWDYHWKMLEHIYSPYTSRTPFTFNAEYVQRSYDMVIWRNPNKMRAPLPPEWLFLNRLQWGLYSVLAQLNATASWSDLWRKVLTTKTAPCAKDASPAAASGPVEPLHAVCAT